MCIIQGEYQYSDVETTMQIWENPYPQYFCAYQAYDDSKLPFDPSLMVYFRKRLTPELLGEINKMILTAQNANKSDNDSDSNSGIIKKSPRDYPRHRECVSQMAVVLQIKLSLHSSEAAFLS